MRLVIILYSTCPPAVSSTSPFHTSPSLHLRGMASSGFHAPNSFAPPRMAISWPYMIFWWMLKLTVTFFLASFLAMCRAPSKRPLTTRSAPPSYSCTTRLWCFSQRTFPRRSFTRSLYSTYPPAFTSTEPFHTSPGCHLRKTPSCLFHRPSLSTFPTTHTCSPYSHLRRISKFTLTLSFDTFALSSSPARVTTGPTARVGRRSADAGRVENWLDENADRRCAPTAEEDATSPEGRAASADAADMLVGGRE